MITYLNHMARGAWTLAVGMRITLLNMFRRRLTVNYPRQSLAMTPSHRSHIELVCDEKTGQPKCVVCLACQKACPSGCIRLDGRKPEGAARKVLTKYTLDFPGCSLCGLCMESCNFGAIKFSKEYNLASLRKEDYQMDLLQRAREKT